MRQRARLARLLGAVFLAASALILASCEIVTGILSWSMFPSFLSGVEATRNLTQDLKDLLPEGSTDFGCRIAVLRSPVYGDMDYVFLLVNTPPGSRVLVLDRDLEVVNTVNGGDFGERMMVDVEGCFVVGNRRFFAPDDPLPVFLGVGDTYIPGVTASGRNCLLSAGGDTLYIDSYDFIWSAPNFRNQTISSAGGDWNVSGAAYDPARAGQEVMLGLYRWDNESLTVLFVDEVGIGTGPLSNPLEGSYPGFTRTLHSVRRTHYTRNGIVVRTEEDDDQCYLLDFGGQELQRFQLRMRGGVEEAYDIEGEHFYYFNRDQRVLFKGRTGW